MASVRQNVAEKSEWICL